MTYDTPEEGNNKTVMIIVGVVAGLLILCCCLVVITLAVLQFTGTFTLPFLGASLGETFTYDEDGMKVEFNYPDDWYAEEDYGDFYAGTQRNIADLDEPEDGEFYLMIFVQSADVIDGNNSEEALENMVEYIEEDDPDLEVSDIKTTKIGGKDAAYVTLSGDSNSFDGEIDGKFIIWEINEDYYGQAVGFSGGLNFSKFKGTMDGILDSFTVEIDE